MIMSKDRERYSLERDEFDKQLHHLDHLEQELNSLALEKQDLVEQNRRLSSQVEVLQTERSQTEIQLQFLRKQNSEMYQELALTKEQLG